MAKIIAVLGATGTQGGSVARTFLDIEGWSVRGITRNRNSAASQTLANLGVDLVEADLDDVSSLERAFSGAHAIFAVTDFWQFPTSPRTHDLAKAENITWNEACYRLEVQQGINIIDAAARCFAMTGTPERLVYSSLSGAKRASKGKYTWVYHFDSKARVVEYLAEKAQDGEGAEYKALLAKTSYLQLGSYMDNWMKNPLVMPRKQPDGSYTWLWVSGPPGSTTPFVHPPTDTGPFVEALVLKTPPRTTLLGTSSVMPYAEFVRLWGDIHGVKASLQSLSVEDVDKLVPGGLGREVGETAAYTQEFGWDGGEGTLLPEQAGVGVKRLTDVETYIRTTDWSAVFAQ